MRSSGSGGDTGDGGSSNGSSNGSSSSGSCSSSRCASRCCGVLLSAASHGADRAVKRPDNARGLTEEAVGVRVVIKLRVSDGRRPGELEGSMQWDLIREPREGEVEEQGLLLLAEQARHGVASHEGLHDNGPVGATRECFKSATVANGFEDGQEKARGVAAVAKAKVEVATDVEKNVGVGRVARVAHQLTLYEALLGGSGMITVVSEVVVGVDWLLINSVIQVTRGKPFGAFGDR